VNQHLLSFEEKN